VEKPKIARASADLKGCYVLIYRKADTPSADSNQNINNGLKLRMPPNEVVKEIEHKVCPKIESEF
jgi:hypothetical protein